MKGFTLLIIIYKHYIIQQELTGLGKNGGTNWWNEIGKKKSLYDDLDHGIRTNGQVFV